MRITRIPLDPATLLMESIARVIREGVSDCLSITAADNVPWTDGAVSPAEHYLVPAGWSLYLDRDPAKCKSPAILITAPEEAKLKNPIVEGMWAVGILIELMIDRDHSVPLLDTIIERLQIVLTETLTLTDLTRQPPQARLSTSALHVDGSVREDNFMETATGKIESENGHPTRALGFMVICGRIAP